MKTLFIFLPLFVSIGASASMNSWQLFQDDPKAYLQGHPMKTDGNEVELNSYSNSPFSRHDIDSGDFVTAKLQTYDQILKHAKSVAPKVSVFAAESDLSVKVADFFDSKDFERSGATPLTRLEDLDSRDLTHATLLEAPWAGSYWPIYRGVIAARYASNRFPGEDLAWSTYKYAVGGDNSLGNIVERDNQGEIDILSPSEKYDLLIGKPRKTGTTAAGFLTPSMWEQGEHYRDDAGKVATWMGICHGWAAAAFMVPRPSQAIQAASPAVTAPLTFYPDDIKGLISQLWAEADYPSSFLGDRCDSKEPKVDPETGRLTDPKCFAVNPGLWHLVVVNQIGLAKRSFVIDASYDWEVWNQPVSGYAFHYFNPQTGQQADNAKAVTIAREIYTKDKFAKYRSPAASAFVGVEMKLSYVTESDPRHAITDSPKNDAIENVTYLYDLELDRNGEILGGEWYRNEHPNFLWLPASDVHVTSSGDSQISGESGWTPDQLLPPFWRDIAISTAKESGEPLSAILDPLVAASHKE